MEYSSIAKRYALSLTEAVLTLNLSLEKTLSELNIFIEIFNSEESLKQLLLNPSIGKQDKKEVLSKIFNKEEISPTTQNLFLVLLDKDRLSLITSIREEFSNQVQEAKKETIATVKSAVALSEKQTVRIKNKLMNLFNKKDVIIKTEIDPSLIGGITINIGSQRIDANVINSFKDFKKAIVN